MDKIHWTWFNIFPSWDILFFQDYRSDFNLYYKYSIVNWIEQISKVSFLNQKFWPHFEAILTYLEDDNERVVIKKDWEIVTCWFRNFYFQWFSSSWELIKKSEKIGFDSIYWFDIIDDNIWYVIPTHNYVGIFSLSENRELLPLENYKFQGMFSMPESISIYNNFAYIADMWSYRVMRINLKSFELEEYLSFHEPVWEYIQLKDCEVVRLSSGVYIL